MCECIDGTPPTPCVDDGDCSNGTEVWNTDTCECEQTDIPDSASCVNDGDCSNGEEVWNTATCECEQLNIPDPTTCIDDGICSNGEEVYNEATCECEQINVPDASTCTDDGDCSNGVEIWNEDICECEQINIPDSVSCVDDGDCSNGEEVWNTTTCECEQLNIPDPTACINDGDCTNGEEFYNEAVCECEQLNIPDPAACIDDGDCTNGIETYNSETCECEALPADCNNAPTTALPCDDGDECTVNDVEIISDCDGSICIPCTGEPIDDSSLFAEDDAYEVIFGQTFAENVTTNDEGGEFGDLMVNIISQPQNGTLIINSDGSFTYEATDLLAETDAFIYEICAEDCPEICATATVNLTVTIDDLIIPNALSPNGDGLNDTWIIPGILEKEVRRMTIVNRWGAVLYSVESYENDWDGTNRDGKPLPEGTYYYYLDMGADEGAREGSITVVR